MLNLKHSYLTEQTCKNHRQYEQIPVPAFYALHSKNRSLIDAKYDILLFAQIFYCGNEFV